MQKRERLKKARNEKDSDYYTQGGDIEEECNNYRNQFKGKTILCNCDDPYESCFFQYFALRFNMFRLKKLIAVSYASSRMAGTELPLSDIGISEGHAYKAEITRLDDFNGDRSVDLEDVKWLMRNDKSVVTQLEGDGDFRSEECMALLDQADIIVTNPPYELFSDFVTLLVSHHKQFLILGSINSLSYKDIFPLIKSNMIRKGCRSFTKNMWFESRCEDAGSYADGEAPEGNKTVNGRHYVLLPTIWYTTFKTKGCTVPLILYKPYSPEEYPRYDNYDAINVNKTADIPYDYYGIIGVPITFLDSFCPDQFEILGCTESEGLGHSNGIWDESSGVRQPMVGGKMLYKRIFIRRTDVA
ncbi:MAG: adenine-specific methyltransferase EcoRI family protein [Clostridia bacterium]|nr:adenine-specific methyltransferase EcoRI family protein [Clostridia bacterium]